MVYTIARQQGQDTRFTMDDLWALFGTGGNLSAFKWNTYSPSILDEFRIGGSIEPDSGDGRIELTEQGRRRYSRINLP